LGITALNLEQTSIAIKLDGNGKCSVTLFFQRMNANKVLLHKRFSHLFSNPFELLVLEKRARDKITTFGYPDQPASFYID